MSAVARFRGVVGAGTAGRLGGSFLLFGALAATANAFADSGPGQRAAELSVTLFAGCGAAFALSAPWERWPEWSTLVLVPVALGLIAYGNYTNPDPYVAGIFFVVIGVWVGLCHGRLVSIAMTPFVAAAYWFPLAARPHIEALGVSVAVVVVVTAAAGEVLSRLGIQLHVAQQSLSEARERRYAALVQRSSDVTLIFGHDGRITYASPATWSSFGYRPEELEGQAVFDFMTHGVRGLAADTTAHLERAWVDQLAIDELLELQVLHADGRWIDIESSVQDHTSDADIRGFVVNIRDISERKSLERALRQQAFHDELTGLPTRALLRSRLQEQLTSAGVVSVIFVDLDGFKAINDTSGHDNGDILLRLVAQRLSATLDADATLARLSGDEFAIGVPHPADRAHTIARAVLDALSEPFTLGVNRVVISASVGIAEGRGSDGPNDVIRDADTAMYVSKARGHNQVTRFERAMRDELLVRLQTETELREALERDDFVIHYQPTVHLRTGRPIGAEALVRWNHPDRGLLPPDQFIDIAEESGLIVPLGRWVLYTACRHAVSWEHDGVPLKLAVNVSARQFQDPRLVDDIRGALDVSGLAPHRLVIEVTESLLITDTELVVGRLDDIAALGVQLALDDFGTGYSSLSYLQQLPFHVLKIDKAFVDDIVDEPNSRTLVRTIISLGHDLGLITLAEGVETDEQAALLAELGCDKAQGYLFSRPVPDDQLDWSGLGPHRGAGSERAAATIDRDRPGIGGPALRPSRPALT